jgi:hypothetical protein
LKGFEGVIELDWTVFENTLDLLGDLFGVTDAGVTNHEANRRAGGGCSCGSRGHANSHASGASQGGYDARQKIEELQRKKSTTAGDNDGFPAFSPRLRNLLLPDKFKPLGITKYDAKQDPIQ